jgi:hypothetical protein
MGPPRADGGRFLYLSAFVQGPVVGRVRLPLGALASEGGLEISACGAAIALCAPVFAFKQLTNLIQMFIAFGTINRIELERRAKGA